jgi:CHAT domain-containing protein
MWDEQELMAERFEKDLSESQINTYASGIKDSLDVLVSMAAEDLARPQLATSSTAGPPLNPRTVPNEALAWTLLRKGIVLDTIARFQWVGKDPRNAQDVRELRRKLSNLELNPPLDLDETQREHLRQQLKKEIEAIESFIRFKNMMHPLNTDVVEGAVQVGDLYRFDGEGELDRMTEFTRRLPPGTALVEFLRARVFDFHAISASLSWKPAHYYAFVLSADHGRFASMFDLGDAAIIDAAIRDLRRNIIEFSRAYDQGRAGVAYENRMDSTFRDSSTNLYELIFAPLRKSLDQAGLIYVSPDGELNRIAFEALAPAKPDSKSEQKSGYLVDDYRFTYLSSGREIARDPISVGHGTIVFADPNYDLGAAKRYELIAGLRSSHASNLTRGNLLTFANDTIAYHPWSQLPATAAEARLLMRELQGTRYGPVLTHLGDEALEELFLAVQSPRILHVASHGFFLPDVQSSSRDTAHTQTSPVIEDPLMRSGIILAGANTLGKDHGVAAQNSGTGWVTAEEIMSMDLYGTELVVLSGCDTGLGDVQTGEGVLGLRRAFFYAGARSLLVSLYKVPDEQTIQLMSRFYESLKSGRGKLDSFHDAQIAVMNLRLRKNGVAHPFYWASFVLLGNPN